MKDQIKKIYNDNKFVFNIIMCVFVVYSLFVVPSYFAKIIHYVIIDEMLCTVIGDIIYTLLLILLYFKELKKEFIVFKSNFKKNIINGFKWYFVGICFMIAVNLFIAYKIGNISDNETLVREYIFSYPFLSAISVMIIAPISEEIIFRKSIMNASNNKYIGIILCELIFGLAHVIGYIEGYMDLIYILPYACLGCSFAIMDYENKNVFTSMFFHSFHNTFSFIMIIVASSLGVL